MLHVRFQSTSFVEISEGRHRFQRRMGYFVFLRFMLKMRVLLKVVILRRVFCLHEIEYVDLCLKGRMERSDVGCEVVDASRHIDDSGDLANW